MKKNFKPINNSFPLARRMVMIVVIWSILFTLGTTAVQVLLDYHQEIDQLNARLQQTRVIEVPNLVNSVWHFDAKQIEMQLQGMLNLQDIRFVKLEVVGGDTYTAGQIIPASDAIIQIEKLELTQNGKSFTLGQLQIVADIRSLQQRVLSRLLRILAFAAIQISLLAGAILWVVQRLLTRPLNEISRYAEGLDLEHLEKPLVLQHRWLATRGDELEMVTLRLNEMRSRLINDVAERMRAEKDLITLAKRLDLATRSAQMGIWDWDIPNNKLVWDDRMFKLYGFTPSELQVAYEVWLNGVHPDDRAPSNEIARRAVQGEIEYDTEFRVLWPDESTHWLKADGQVFRNEQGEAVRMVGVNYDITERKQAEEALRKSYERLEKVLEVETVGVMFWDLSTGCMTEANDAFLKLMGYSRLEVEERELTWQKLTPPEYTEMSLAELQKFQATGRVGPYEKEYFRKDGTRQWLIFAGSSLGDNVCVEFCVDISDRKQAEHSLREAEERYRNLLESAPVGIAVHSDGKIVFTNPAGVKLLGGESEEQIVGMSVFDIIHPDGLKVTQSRIQRMLAGEKGLYPAEDTYLKLDGTSINVEVTATALNYNGKPAVQVIIADITERKRSEERIRRQINYLTALQDIDRAIAAAFDMHPSLNALISKAVSLLGVDAAGVLLINSSMDSLEFAAGDGFRTDAIENAKLKIGEGYASRVMQEHRIVKIPDLKNEAENPFLTGFLKEEGFASYYGAPLVVKGKVIGVLEVFHRSLIKRDQEWLDFLNALAGQAAVAISNAQLFEHLQQSNINLLQAYDATIEGWSRAMDLRDKETEGHTLRVTEMNLRLADLMHVSAADQVHLRRGSLLHDIGKLGVPDAILLKPGKLTAEEMVIMRRHPTHAYEMLSSVEYIRPALDIPYCHHEKWDGTGYPRGLKGEQIPLVARIFAIVDVWDALRSDRPYRAAWTYDQAREYIIKQSGKHFEPHIVDVFLKMLDESPELY